MQARAEGVREVGKNHLKFRIQDPTGGLDAIAFERADRVPADWLQGPVDVAFRLEENEFQGRVSLQARVLDLRPSD